MDLFAGGGGASTGIEAALGRSVDIAINHDPVALAVHCENHPQTRHITTDVRAVRPLEVTGGRRVSLLWCSPDCTHFSSAKGGKPRNNQIRSLAEEAVKWAEQVRPDVICVENVREFLGWGPLDDAGYPIEERKGETFREWRAELERLGYVFDYRILDSADFGAPTRRKRLFIVARCDGRPIRWPEPTHGPGLVPYRVAAECIDFAIPTRSIFGRRRPLVERTHWRIAQGLWRHVFADPDPFIVRGCAHTIQQSGYGERPGQAARVPGVRQPLGVVMAKGQKHALVSAFLAKHYGDPLRTTGGGRVIGSDLRAPIATITGKDHHSLAAITLAKFRGTSDAHPGCADPFEPMPTVSAQGCHIGEVRAFLSAYYGSDATGQALSEPLRTITARARLGLVLVAGYPYQITDIGFRMLHPSELLRAQFGRFASGYSLERARRLEDKIRLIGNSVCPEVAEAIIRVNVGGDAARAA